MTSRPMGARGVGIWGSLLLASLSLACGAVEPGSGDAAKNASAKHEESEVRGPNGGRLLTSGAFELELGIFEGGTRPEYRAWASADGRVIESGDFTLDVSCP